MLTRARQRLYLTCARRRNLYGGAGHNLPSRFLAELPEALVDERQVSAPRTGWSGDAGGARCSRGSFGSGGGRAVDPGRSRKQPAPPLAAFALGDDVVHATFGEGVVTAVEPGSVVVVRFAADGDRAQADGRLRPAQEA